MTTSEAVRLRKRWKILKYPIKCQHRVKLLERSDKGHLTGNYVCSTCGEVLIPRIYPTEDREAKQRVSKALVQHPLVLLDQQLKRLVKEVTMLHKDRSDGYRSCAAGNRRN
jgi:hypothetical protein